jgi:hypothetical protein
MNTGHQPVCELLMLFPNLDLNLVPNPLLTMLGRPERT